MIHTQLLLFLHFSSPIYQVLYSLSCVVADCLPIFHVVRIFSAEDNPCTSLKCAPNRDCSIDHMGKATCVCPMPCQQTMELVCGSDGKTYDNPCELKRQTCLQNTYAMLAHYGPCGRHSSQAFTIIHQIHYTGSYCWHLACRLPETEWNISQNHIYQLKYNVRNFPKF